MLIGVPFIVYQHLFHRSITSLSLFNDISFIVLWVIFHRFVGSNYTLSKVVYLAIKLLNLPELKDRELSSSNYFHEQKYLFSRQEIFIFMKKNNFFHELINHYRSLSI